MRALLLLFLAGCSAVPNHWTLDSIASESKRLIYVPQEQYFGMKLEFIGSENSLAAYLSSQGKQFGSGQTVKIRLDLGEEIFDENLPLHEGRMRVRLSDALALKTIQHLKDGKPLTIILGTIEQTIEPEQFSALIQEFGKVL